MLPRLHLEACQRGKWSPRTGLTFWYGSLTDDALTSDGGTVAATQAARADAHAKLLAFLASQ